MSTTVLDDTQEAHEYEGFQLSLKNFSGPFDLLLSLIAKRQLDVTEVALAEVTDEFLAYVANISDAEAALDTTTSFVVVAATLLDLKTARLLPAGFSDPEEELALLEERDLLFARLLQYKAYKEAAGMMRQAMAEQALTTPRVAGVDIQHEKLLPPLVWGITAVDFAHIAHEVFTHQPEAPPQDVDIAHLHAPQVSVGEQIQLMGQRLKQAGTLNFSQLIADATSTMMVVARFMGLLMMYRDKLVEWNQQQPLSEITVTWTAQN